MADLGRHAADLAIAAFFEGQFNPGIRDVSAVANGRIARPWLWAGIEDASLGRASAVTGEQDSGREPFHGIGGWGAFNLSPVGTRVSELWIGEPVLESTIVGEQDEPFAVVIEPPGGIDIGDIYEIGECARCLRGAGELAHDVVGLVEEDVPQAPW